KTFMTTRQIMKIDEKASSFISKEMMIGLLEKQKQNHTEISFIMNKQAIGYSEYESQIVQGIMDCLLEIDGHYTIIDYKTDSIPPMFTEDDLAARYRTQMEIYRRSAEKARGTEVTAQLYFLTYGAIQVYD